MSKSGIVPDVQIYTEYKRRKEHLEVDIYINTIICINVKNLSLYHHHSQSETMDILGMLCLFYLSYLIDMLINSIYAPLFRTRS